MEANEGTITGKMFQLGDRSETYYTSKGRVSCDDAHPEFAVCHPGGHDPEVSDA